MSAESRFPWMTMVGVLVVATGLELFPPLKLVRSETCALSPHHAGMVFPVERIDPEWICLLQPIIDNYTTVTTVGPVRAAMSESMYHYLLDHPPVATLLIGRLELGLYKSEERGPDRFWGSDGEGTQGIVQLVYKDRTARLYYLEGSHNSRVLPDVTGKAVVLFRMKPVVEPNGAEAMDSTVVSYTKLDNRILSGLVSLMRPLIGGVVTGKLRKGAETVNRLGLVMRQHPERVLSQAMDLPALSDRDVDFLKQSLGGADDFSRTGRPNGPTP
ncbi:MAG: hypothetical protein K2Q17_04125 [Nitrospiraceae bacterium]|uniref:hypothetical protein n=1 Tax=Nitrospira cf. moscoviensis SBR1015 TaxID=96242 RepID=UPI00111FED45|nr:hypothetical protein [Nitrospira cf. moscoviensis SBR1015]MBY0246836.1 hypothetical protein [Nitrospiraceae bacterium]